MLVLSKEFNFSIAKGFTSTPANSESNHWPNSVIPIFVFHVLHWHTISGFLIHVTTHVPWVLALCNFSQLDMIHLDQATTLRPQPMCWTNTVIKDCKTRACAASRFYWRLCLCNMSEPRGNLSLFVSILFESRSRSSPNARDFIEWLAEPKIASIQKVTFRWESSTFYLCSFLQ